MAEPGTTPIPTVRCLTPTGAPCPRSVRVDGSVDGTGACFGCGTCLLFGGLLDHILPASAPFRH